MNNIIQQITVKLVEKVLKSLEKDGIKSIGVTTKKLGNIVNASILEIVGAAVEQMDGALVAANKERRRDGLRVQERNIPRTIMTDMGEFRYKRTCFKTKAGEYYYLTDCLIGVERYERITKELCADLVQSASEQSMARAAKSVRADVSRQTVNNKVLAMKEVAAEAVRAEKLRGSCTFSPTRIMFI